MLLVHCLLVHVAVFANLHADSLVAHAHLHLHLLPNQTESDQLADLDHDHTPTRLPGSAEAHKAVVVGRVISAFVYVYGEAFHGQSEHGIQTFALALHSENHGSHMSHLSHTA